MTDNGNDEHEETRYPEFAWKGSFWKAMATAYESPYNTGILTTMEIMSS
jgi:hypothetical protein